MLRYTLLACVSFTTAYQLAVRAPSVRAPAARALRATPDDAPAEPVDDALDAVAESVDDTPDAVAEAKDALLQAIAGTDRGFKKDKSMAASVRNEIHALSDYDAYYSKPDVRPPRDASAAALSACVPPPCRGRPRWPSPPSRRRWRTPRG